MNDEVEVRAALPSRAPSFLPPGANASHAGTGEVVAQPGPLACARRGDEVQGF
jgi:hypothetical protein